MKFNIFGQFVLLGIGFIVILGIFFSSIGEMKDVFTPKITFSLVSIFAILSFMVWSASRTVDKQQKELRGYTTKLEKMVEERTKKLKEVSRREVSQAKELVRLKEQFVFVATHELRSAANAMKWGLEALIPKQKERPQHEQDIFDVVWYSNQRLLALVRDLLDIARIESKTIKFNMGELQIHDVVDEIITELKPMSEKYKAHLYNDIPENFPIVWADKVRLKEVFINLLSNALKYNKNDEGGGVWMRGEIKDDMAIIHIADNGIGVRKEDQKHLFHKFWRAKEVLGMEGTGLGLFIVKQLIEIMGGTIWFSSNPECQPVELKDHKESSYANGEEEKGAIFSFSLKQFKEDMKKPEPVTPPRSTSFSVE